MDKDKYYVIESGNLKSHYGYMTQEEAEKAKEIMEKGDKIDGNYEKNKYLVVSVVD